MSGAAYEQKPAGCRPMGLAEGPDGSLYISESNQGKIWRVMYRGDKDKFSSKELAKMEERKSQSYLKTPNKEEDVIHKGNTLQGSILYNTYCASCHQGNGKGDDNRYPPLAGSNWVTGDNDRLARVILNGLKGELEVNGKTYNGIMPGFSNALDDLAVASIITYVRKRFNANDKQITPAEVSEMRNNFN